MDPARTCLGCRSRDTPSALLRMVLREGRVIPDPSASLPGRGGWIHPSTACVERAVARRAFGRAFRVSAQLNVGAVQATVEASSLPEEQAD